ncbi:Iron uptake system component EfeO precursor [compost metagenome]
MYLSTQGSMLTKAVTALEQAIGAGDLEQAQALYLPARAAYQRLAPAAQRLGQLDNAINARADYFEKREQDPGFVGFHRLEYALFEQRNLDGLAPFAQRLLTDVTALKQQLLAQSLAPEQLVSIVVRNLDNIAQVRAQSGEEERYSHSDLNGFAGNLDASRKVVELLRPLLGKSDAPLLTNIDTALADFAAELDGFKVDGGYASYDSVSAEQRQQIADKAKALAAALDAIDPALGLSGL